MMGGDRYGSPLLIGTVDFVETPDSILAKFDELIADLSSDSARDKRQTREVEFEAKREAERNAEVAAELENELEAESESSRAKPAYKREITPAIETETEGNLEVKPAITRVTPASKSKSKGKSKKAPEDHRESVLAVTGLTKRFGDTTAVDGIDLTVKAGTIFGIVGPNGAGKTTTLSMITGLLRPDSGTVVVHGHDVWANPALAKSFMGVLPDRLRLFDRLTGGQLLYYAGVLRGLPKWAVRERMWQLATALGFDEALGRLVADYSAGMMKKITLAAALIHSPRLLVLDEPFESVDPVSVASIVDILAKYVEAGGTVVLSSHSMDLIQRMCDSVAIIVGGEVLASGTVDEVRGQGSLEEKFIELAGGVTVSGGLEWLHSFSD